MKAARGLNRSCIGIEMEPEYIRERVFTEYTSLGEEGSETKQAETDF